MENGTHLTLDANSCKPLREIVFDTIRNAIVRGDLKPGQRLMEVQLAQELGVSRTPVRESIRKLELEGLVKMVARKGAYVTPLTIDDLEEMMEIRRALEALAAELAAKNATDEQIEELKAANQEFEDALRANDEEKIIESDIRFHDVLYDSSGNKKLSQMTNSLREQMQRIRVEYVHKVTDKDPLIGQHESIIEFVEKGIPQAASETAAEHIEITERDMIQVLETEPEIKEPGKMQPRESE
ncbi:MAG: GntR family transcriptional regulator [Eubacteriaceae bacterium]|jgi:DNA-binding GntR family transcriptional regulator